MKADLKGILKTYYISAGYFYFARYGFTHPPTAGPRIPGEEETLP